MSSETAVLSQWNNFHTPPGAKRTLRENRRTPSPFSPQPDQGDTKISPPLNKDSGLHKKQDGCYCETCRFRPCREQWKPMGPEGQRSFIIVGEGRFRDPSCSARGSGSLPVPSAADGFDLHDKECDTTCGSWPGCYAAEVLLKADFLSRRGLST